MSAVDQELSEQLKNWNPMRDDYKDSKFNTYSSGPGANLDESLQPAELAKLSGFNQRAKDPYLVFKFVPTTLTQQGLVNICSAYGKCLRSRKHGTNMYFIDFASINDMERVFTGLQDNTYGFRVELAKSKDPQDNQLNSKQNTSALPNLPSISTNEIDYDRSYQVSSRNAPRPHFAKTPLVRKEDYDNPQNNLSRNDPQRHFLIEEDAHELERVPYVKKTKPVDGKFNYHTGRAYYTMSQMGKQFIEDKQKSTNGDFDSTMGLQRINLEKQALSNAAQILQDLNTAVAKGKSVSEVESIRGSIRKAISRLQRINLEKQALSNAAQILQDLNTAVAKGKSVSEVESIRGSIRKAISGFFSKSSESFEKANIISCGHCGKECDSVCPRCMTGFCSAQCQKAEWNRHRYICGKPKSMWPAWAKHLAEKRNSTEQIPTSEVQPSPNSAPQQDASKKAALKAQLPPSGNNVLLTAIPKTNVVFVRSTSYEDNLLFFNTISTIQKAARSQPSILHTPGRGDIVLTKFQEDQYNRAMILNPDDLDNIKLIYIDYGNIDSKSLDELYNAPEQFWNLPRMAVPIILKDVPDFFMTDEVKEYMYSYMNKDMKIVYDEDDFENEVNRAELFDLSKNESFNANINSFRAGAEDKKKTPVVFREFLDRASLPTGENIELVVTDNSLLQTGFVSCTTQGFANEIQKFQKDVQKYAQSTKATSKYTPRVNELCLAKYSEDDLWYRGRCIEVVGDGHPTILFIDYGNLSIVSVENIRKYPEEFTFPLMTADCEISGLPDKIGDDLKTKLEELLQPGTKILCKSVDDIPEDNIYTINLGSSLQNIIS